MVRWPHRLIAEIRDMFTLTEDVSIYFLKYAPAEKERGCIEISRCCLLSISSLFVTDFETVVCNSPAGESFVPEYLPCWQAVDN